MRRQADGGVSGSDRRVEEFGQELAHGVHGVFSQ